MATPFVTIPKSLTSKDHLLLDLGKISIGTTFIPANADGNSFSVFNMSVKDLEFLGISYDKNGKEIISSRFLCNFHVDVEAKVMLEGKPTETIPEVSVGLYITEDVIFNITTQQVGFLVDTVNQTLALAEKSDGEGKLFMLYCSCRRK